MQVLKPQLRKTPCLESIVLQQQDCELAEWRRSVQRERLEGFVSRVETTSLLWVGDRGQTQKLDLKGLILKIIRRRFLLDVR